MTRIHRVLAPTCAVMLALTTGLPLAAQAGAPPARTEAGDTAMTRRCAADAAADTVPWSISPAKLVERLERCEQSAPPALARHWATVRQPGPLLLALSLGSRFIRDERILQAMKDVAMDEMRPDSVRMVAMNALANYVVPGLASWPLRDNPGSPLLERVAEFDTISGGQPLGAQVAERVDATLQRVALGNVQVSSRIPNGSSVRASDVIPPPTDVHVYAEHLRRALATAVQLERYAVAPPLVRLAYICGNRFRVRNDTPFFLSLGYDVVGAGPTQYDVRVQPGADVTGGATTEFTAPATGKVRLFYMGKVIVSRENGGKACPP